MRVLIFGANGMLGHKLYQTLQGDFEVYGTVRSDFEPLRKFGFFNEEAIIPDINVLDHQAVRQTVERLRPDCVINAVGVIKQVMAVGDPVATLAINSIFPRRLADLASEMGFRLLTISTDCVFDGKRGNYSETDVPDATDLYGISKLLGEAARSSRVLTLRTSLVGRELQGRNSIIEWFLANRGGTVEGYTTAIYSGFPTIVLAEIIADLIANRPDLSGVYHVSSEPISKYDLLKLVNEAFNAGVTIEPSEDVVIDRSLDSSKFRSEVGFEPQSWPEMIEAMADDPTPYEKWKS